MTRFLPIFRGAAGTAGHDGCLAAWSVGFRRPTTRAFGPLLAAVLCWVVGGSSAHAEGAAIPDPLSLDQALAYAEQHPRARLGPREDASFPRRPGLYLACHRLAFSSTSEIDVERSPVVGHLVSPAAAQRLEILARFLDVLLADLNFSSYNEALAVAYIRYDRANARRELGQYSELQVADLEADYQEILQKRVASEAAQRLSRALLAQALGHPRELPRDLSPPALARPPADLPSLEAVVAAAAQDNPWLGTLKAGLSEPEQQLVDLELNQQALELLLRLETLRAVERYAHTETSRRDLRLEESRILYEQEVRGDLGFSMSQQTEAHTREKQVAYCQVLTWAELNALQGRAFGQSDAKGG